MSAPALSFSVVVTCYNYEAYVGDAVAAALGQTSPPHEVVVIDDGSRDDSAGVLARRFGGDARVRVLTQANSGQLASFVAGVRAASGDVVCFLDADDLWEPGYLAALAAAYGGQDAPDMVLSNLRRFGGADSLWHRRNDDRDLGSSVLSSWMVHYFTVTPTSAVSMKRELALRVLDLPQEYFALWRVRADDCLLLGANLLDARSMTLAEPHVLYRVHGQNNWAGKRQPPLALTRYSLRLSSMIEHHAARAGLSPRHLRMAYLEFKTKQRPTARELRMYLWLQWIAPRSWFDNLRPCAAILKHHVLSLLGRADR